jgi:hypothetical protein
MKSLGMVRILTYKCETFNLVNRNTCTINCNHSIAATLYTLETWFQVYNCVPCRKMITNNNNNNNNNTNNGLSVEFEGDNILFLVM